MVNLTQKWGVVRFCKVFSHDRRWVACTHPPKDRNCGLLHVSSYTHLVTMNHNDIMVRSTTIQNHQAYPLSHQSQSQINTLRNSGNVIYIYVYIYIYIYVCVYARWIRDGMMFKTQQDPYSRKKRVFFGVFSHWLIHPKSKERLFHPEPQMRYWDEGERMVGSIAKLVEPTRLTRGGYIYSSMGWGKYLSWSA